MSKKLMTPPLMVYRIQNKSGNGVYRPEETSKKRIIRPHNKNDIIDAIDDLARTGDRFRYPPDLSELITTQELKSFKAGTYLSGFSSLSQLVGWFPFKKEIEILNSYGFHVYRVYAKKVISLENQCLFIPMCKIGQCSEQVTEDMISDDEARLIATITKNRISVMSEIVKKDTTYDDNIKEEVLNIING